MADIKCGVTTFAMPTSSGLFEVTKAGLGFTPKLAIFTASTATVNRTQAAHKNVIHGMTDGSSQWAFSAVSRDNRGTSDVNRSTTASSAIHLVTATGVIDGDATGVGDGSAGNPGPIDNGWRLNFTNPPASAYLCLVVFLGGDDLQVDVGISAGLTTGTDVISVGFNPELFFFGGAYTTFDGVSYPGSVTSFGAAMYKNSTITQRAIGYESRDSQPVTRSYHKIITAGCHERPTNSNGSEKELRVSAVNQAGASSTFTIESYGTDFAGNKVGYCVLNLGGNNYHVDDFLQPSSTSSDWTVTGVGFQAGAMLAFFSTLNALDVYDNTGGEVAAYGVGAYDGTDQSCVSWSDRSDANTTITKSYFSTQDFEYVWNYSGSGVNWDLRNPTFNSDGFTVAAADIDSALGSTAYNFGVFIELDSGSGGGGSPSTGAGLPQTTLPKTRLPKIQLA